MVNVVPAILEKDFSEIEKKIRLIDGLTEWIQIDFADGVLVPNTTYLDLPAFAKLKIKSRLEAHLMVKEPIKYLKPLFDSGFKRFYAHIESGEAEKFVNEAYKLDCQVGLAIDGPTNIAEIKPYLDNIDAVLVMTIDAGFSGKPFREDTLEKIRIVREDFFDLPIAVDGAMNDINAKKAVKAGANIICSNSFIFGSANMVGRIEILRNLVGSQ